MNKHEIKIQNITNAFLRIEYKENVILCDPWLTNRIFDGSWMVYPPVYDIDQAISGVTHVFISHIHKDHCDFNLMQHFPKSTLFYIPDIFPNDKIKLQLNILGFENIIMMPIAESIHIIDDLELYVIPPMNTYGQETEEMYLSETNGIPIDCGLLLTTEDKKLCILADDSPYHFNHIPETINLLKNSDIVMMPHNGYAADFPLNFINFSKKERTELSHNQSNNRLELQSKFIDKIKPKNILLYSSDFALAGPVAKDFYEIHPEEWVNKSKACKIYESKTGIATHYLYVNDIMVINNDLHIKRSNSEYPSLKDFSNNIYSSVPNTKYLFKPIESVKILEELISSSCVETFNKMEKFDIQSKSSLLIEVKDINKKYHINFETKQLTMNYIDSPLRVYIDSNYLNALLNFHSHWNDAQISHNLFWAQETKYDPAFNKILCFFHKKIVSKPPLRI
tara:strand:- start:3602 stop:4954 length:1353 start_codon:yes stop_codon:yes gene_type:complete